MVTTVSSRYDGFRLKFRFKLFCVEFQISPDVFESVLQVLRLPPTVQRHADEVN